MSRTLIGWLNNTFKRGDPIRKVSNHVQANRIANVLLDIKGVGCRIEKPTNAEGRGWKVIVDGTSDEEFPDEVPSFFSNPIPSGTTDGDLLYWDETDEEWKVLAAPATHAVLCFNPSDTGAGGLVWRTAAHDYQVLQRKADDTVGFDWVRAHE